MGSTASAISRPPRPRSFRSTTGGSSESLSPEPGARPVGAAGARHGRRGHTRRPSEGGARGWPSAAASDDLLPDPAGEPDLLADDPHHDRPAGHERERRARHHHGGVWRRSLPAPLLHDAHGRHGHEYGGGADPQRKPARLLLLPPAGAPKAQRPSHGPRA